MPLKKRKSNIIAVCLFWLFCSIFIYCVISATITLHLSKKKVQSFCSCEETGIGKSMEGHEIMARKNGLAVAYFKKENGDAELLAYSGWFFLNWSCILHYHNGIVVKRVVFYAD